MKYFSSLSAQACENTTLLYGHFHGCIHQIKVTCLRQYHLNNCLTILGIKREKILHSWSEAVLLRFIQGQINFNKNFQSPAISPPPCDISSASNEISLHRSLAKYRSGKYWRNRKHQTRSYLHRLFTSRRESKLRNALLYEMMRRSLNRTSWKFLLFTVLYYNVITSK